MVNLLGINYVGLHILPIQDQQLDVSLFPNPNNGNFNMTIDSPGQDRLNVLLFNQLGTLVSRKQIALSAGKQTVPVSWTDEADGLYFVVLQSSDGSSSSERLLIQR